MLLFYSLALYLGLSSSTTTLAYAASSPKETPPPAPCTIHSPSHAFFDLNPLHIQDPATSKAKHPRENSYNTTGWDIGYNFTMNFCGPVIEHLDGVVGVEKEMWRNVSAYYKKGGKVYSIGQQNSSPVFRGRKLVLNYTNGSPCESDGSARARALGEELAQREIIDGPKKGSDKDDKKHKGDEEDDDDDKDDKKKEKTPAKKPASSAVRRKSTIISMLCDKDPLSPQLTLSFVSASPDECTYFFEARSSAACQVIEVAKQTLSPSGVFGVIVLIFVIVYFVGGCVYSRMVLQQRGWRQVPNYALWAGMFGFVRDLVIILTSSCTRFLPSRRGYTRVNGGMNGGMGSGRGRGRGDSDAENRLIDELNEEWDD